MSLHRLQTAGELSNYPYVDLPKSSIDLSTYTFTYTSNRNLGEVVQ